MIQFKENTQTDRWKDRQTLFYKTLPATAGGPIISMAPNQFAQKYKGNVVDLATAV